LTEGLEDRCLGDNIEAFGPGVVVADDRDFERDASRRAQRASSAAFFAPIAS
jgi:hypothetical protein